MNPIPEKTMKKYERILARYDSERYARLEDSEINRLIRLAGEKKNSNALSEIKDMAYNESRHGIYERAAITLDNVVHDSTMGLPAQEHAEEDLSEIFRRINYASRILSMKSDWEEQTPEEAKEEEQRKARGLYALAQLREAGILLGHIGVVKEASKAMGTPIIREEAVLTLINGLKERGSTIDDKTTSVGECYMALFGADFMGRYTKEGNGDYSILYTPEMNGIRSNALVPYPKLPSEQKERICKKLLDEHLAKLANPVFSGSK